MKMDINNKKEYYKPKYAEHTREQLEHEIVKNFDEIQYLMCKEIDLSKLDRRKIEYLHELIQNLWFEVNY